MKLARRINVSDIEKMKKGSVVWYEYHVNDYEANIDYHCVIPMLISVPGKNGVLCWIDHYAQLDFTINEDLEKDNRIFWDKEPDESQITFGISEEEYNSLW